jgi:hypothetical protein
VTTATQNRRNGRHRYVGTVNAHCSTIVHNQIRSVRNRPSLIHGGWAKN